MTSRRFDLDRGLVETLHLPRQARGAVRLREARHVNQTISAISIFTAQKDRIDVTDEADVARNKRRALRHSCRGHAQVRALRVL